MIILERLTGKWPGEPMNGMDLPQWVASIVKENWTNEVFDLEVMRDTGTIGEDKLLNAFKLAQHCENLSPAARPEFQQVVQQIEENKTQRAAAASSADHGAEVPGPAGE